MADIKSHSRRDLTRIHAHVIPDQFRLGLLQVRLQGEGGLFRASLSVALTHRLSCIVQAEDQDTVLVLLLDELVESMDQRKHIVLFIYFVAYLSIRPDQLLSEVNAHANENQNKPPNWN